MSNTDFLLQIGLVREAAVELSDLAVKAVDLLAEHEEVHQVLVGVLHLELLESLLVLLLRHGALHHVVLVLQDLLLDLLACLLGRLYLVSVLVLDSAELLNEILSVLRRQVVVLSQMLRSTSES